MSSTKTALITGGAKGIGRAISEELASQGWNLILWGRDEPALEKAASELESRHRVGVQIRRADLSDLSCIPTCFKEMQVQKLLPQALICNSGDYGTLGDLKDVDIEKWRKSFDLNFFSYASLAQSYVNLAQELDPASRKSLILMGGSGQGGAKVWPGISAYSCAKAAIYRLTEVLHEEVHASLNIDVNCLAPGAIKTGITDQAIHAGQQVLGGLYQASVSVVQSGGDSPALVSQCVARLLSDACSGISGRLISAKWDGPYLDHPSELNQDRDLLRLRRIDKDLFVRK